MKIQLVLMDYNDRGDKEISEVDLPFVPRKGECITFGDTGGCWEVSEVIWRFNEDGVFRHVTVDALSVRNRE